MQKWLTKYLSLVSLLSVCICFSSQKYQIRNSLLCINKEFIWKLPGVSVADCCLICTVTENCQAFSMADGPCQLFLFDKCSKSVRNCSCSRRGHVFVKQQPGLEAGALCPSGYGDDLCGVKYKLYFGTGSWWSSREKCESESGLVIMADVTDATEMSHVENIYDSKSKGTALWLGGYQVLKNLSEPAGGWYWIGCNFTVDGSLWANGEPNNIAEDAVVRWQGKAKLTDFNEFISTSTSALCECVSPFD